jgi:hypothetical protein
MGTEGDRYLREWRCFPICRYHVRCITVRKQYFGILSRFHRPLIARCLCPFEFPHNPFFSSHQEKLPQQLALLCLRGAASALIKSVRAVVWTTFAYSGGDSGCSEGCCSSRGRSRGVSFIRHKPFCYSLGPPAVLPLLNCASSMYPSSRPNVLQLRERLVQSSTCGHHEREQHESHFIRNVQLASVSLNSKDDTRIVATFGNYQSLGIEVL